MARALVRKLIALCLWALVPLLVLPAVVFAQDDEATGQIVDPALLVIEEIRFVGNRVTKPAVMVQEMTVYAGDAINYKEIEKSRQAIMDLGIFKSVRTDLLPSRHGYVLQITVDEKFYVLPIPQFNRDAEGDIKYGAELRLDNLSGLNQRLKLSWDRKQFADKDLSDRDKVEIEYRYPRIIGTPYQFQMEADLEETEEEATSVSGEVATYNRYTDGASFHISRWQEIEGPSRGVSYGFGMSRSETIYEHVDGPTGLLNDGNVVTVNSGIGFESVHDYEFSRSGRAYGYGISIALPSMGSDDDYTAHNIYYRGYYLLEGRAHQNLNVQFALNFSNQSATEGEGGAFSLGGSSSLRGYERGTFTGNATWALNFEYLFPLGDYYPFRVLVLADVGKAYPTLDDLDLRDLKWDAGLGFRWKLRSFVKTDLRFDAAHAPETGETKIYVSTSETF